MEFKALQVKLESAIFQSDEFRYFITLELDHTGDKVCLKKSQFISIEKNRHFRESFKPHFQRKHFQSAAQK